MSRVQSIIGVLVAVCCGAPLTTIAAGETDRAEPISQASVKHIPAGSPVDVEKECVGADGASVCWLKFTDGTRCVVASKSESGDSSTALNCHFSTPVERLHRIPKD